MCWTECNKRLSNYYIIWLFKKLSSLIRIHLIISTKSLRIFDTYVGILCLNFFPDVYFAGLKRSCWTTPSRSRSPKSPLTHLWVIIISLKLCLPLRSPKAPRYRPRGADPSPMHSTLHRYSHPKERTLPY